MKDKLTIIIPTHNRPALIARALDYYKTWGCTIIVCDSSREQPMPIYLPNIQTLYTPEFSLNQKLAFAIKQVVTPYVCLSADDDFLAASGVMTGIRYLEEHHDYVSVQGHYVIFNWVMQRLLIYPNYLGTIGFHIDDADAAKRIVHTMKTYMHHIYSVHRLDILQKSLAIMKDLDLILLFEHNAAINGMIYGKHKVLPVFWMARDSECYISENHSATDKHTARLEVISSLATPYGLSYRERFANAYASHVGDSIDKGREIFDRAFSAYLSNRPSIKVKSKLRQTIRQCLPDVVLQWRRLFLGKSVVPKMYSKLPGYPFGDSMAKQDWELMKEIIVKHGQISAVGNTRPP